MQNTNSEPSPGPSSSNSSSKKWTCNVCTYENWSSAVRCTMCQVPHTPKVINDVVGAQTLQNNKNSIVRSRGTSPSNFEVKWACPMCTYLNWPRATKCIQCLTSRKKRVSPNMSVAGSVSPHSSPPASLNYNVPAALPITSAMDNLRINESRISADFVQLSASSTQQTNNERNLRVSPVNNNGKWVCPVCTYENWPRSKCCVLCKTRNIYLEDSRQSHGASQPLRNSPSPPAAAGVNPGCEIDSFGEQNLNLQGNNYDYERKMRQFRRRMRETDWTWLTACMGVVEGDMNPIEAYLNGGGDPTRKLTHSDVMLLNKANIYEPGHTLVHLAIRFHREDMLGKLLSQLESGGTNSGIKCVPSYVAPDLASAIRRYISQLIRQRKGAFPCYYIAEWSTYSLPPEIEDLPSATQDQLYSELLDRDAQKELEEDDLIINWSEELRIRLGSRLHALWNRSAGDCLLDSVLQATWGVFDRDNHLRRAMADSLHEAGHLFYPRWKEWEISQAMEMAFTLRETQLASDWTSLLNLASQPGSSLEQIHIFCLSHVLRRPIIVYGVKYVKSWRGENLGYARFEGVYLPLLWEPSFCSRSPIALGFTRGHFCALIPPEPITLANCAGAAAANHASSEGMRASFLPLMTSAEDRQLLPVHFLSRTEAGREEEILREWLDVCVTDSGIMVARQRMAKPPLLVAQMTEEWLNHYRKIAQSSIAPFNSRTGASAASSVHQSANNYVHLSSPVATLDRNSKAQKAKLKTSDSMIGSKSPPPSAATTLAATTSALKSSNASGVSSSNNNNNNINACYSSDGDFDEE